MAQEPAKSVFIIGDSISLEYHPYLVELCRGTFEYDRKGGAYDRSHFPADKIQPNGGDSRRVLSYLQDLSAAGDFRVDLLLINCGLHDIKSNPQTGEKQVPPDEYRQNLNKIADLAKSLCRHFVWIRTTAVDETRHNSIAKEFHRYEKDHALYNQIADEVMTAAGAAILDLCTFTQRLGADLYRDHVHFKPEVCAKQAAFVFGWLCGYLACHSAP